MVSKASKIMLGTVQFGLDYGIANRAGKVPYGEARAMVEYALGKGVDSFDTAPGYGDSEEVLGRIFGELGAGKEKIFISDKIPPVPEGFSAEEAAGFIKNSVLGSLKKLKVDFIDLCLFHREKDACYMESLAKLKEEGFIKEAGVSVYNPDAAFRIMGKKLAGALQVPASALDKRFYKSGFFENAVKAGVCVFARSVYLQGLLLMGEDETPEHLAEARPAVSALRKLAAGAGLGMGEFALRYVLSIKGISSVLSGADSIKQLKENLNAVEKGALPQDLFEKAVEAVPELSEYVLLPFNWEKKNV